MRASSEDLGKLLLRVTVGGLMLFHGIAKLQHGVGFIEGMLEGKGLPAFLAYGAYVGEVIAPLLLLVGFQTRIAGAVLAFNMVTAIGLAHANQLFDLNAHGGWAIELAAFFLLGGLCIALLGSGRFALDARRRSA
jgi:putative oxidoreductase